MSNHVSMTDSVVIFSLAGHLGEEAHIRAYAKKSLAYQPVIGARLPTRIFQLPCNAKAAQ
jgi:1-acyl-sn-glycerol-3-phosphate acyltransferase